MFRQLTQNNIKWKKEPNSFTYEFENVSHLYYPDFYLPELDCYIEVKGIMNAKDIEKWKVVPKLFVINGTKEFYKYLAKQVNIKDELTHFLKQNP